MLFSSIKARVNPGVIHLLGVVQWSVVLPAALRFVTFLLFCIEYDTMNTSILSEAAAQARGLAIDAVHACSSGHLGLPLGAAEVGAVLFGEVMRCHPAQPRWINRDRFILSAGHGSMFLYGWLHIAGYKVSRDDLRNFRQLHSITPGHPEFGETDGVEATTGPLGQGIGNAVGYAMSGKMAAARFNTEAHTIFDYHVIALAGDGCMQEGVVAEAAAFAGHNGLDNLIVIYDSNDVTLDAMAEVTQSADTAARFEALGWDAVAIDGHDLAAVEDALTKAKSNRNGRPKLILARTEIGRGIPQVAGTAAGHGEGGAKYADEARAGLGLPDDETFYVSDGVRDYFTGRNREREEAYRSWLQTYEEWADDNAELASLLEDGMAKKVPGDLFSLIPESAEDLCAATRVSAGEVMQHAAEAVPMLVSGSADLYGSTKNYIKPAADWGRQDFGGRNIWFGIREHAMGAILNGIAYDGVFRASGATFAVFADYLRPAIRLAALARLPVIYIFTHDSVGVGEDGPTHQPVETCSGLRVIPGLDVIRPCDAEEAAGAWVGALQRIEGPTALMLTRQNVPNMNEASAAERREGTLRGGYILRRETADLQLILIATGSEVQHAVAAAEELGAGVRVVSIPCMERFDRQPESYREEILPASCRRRVAIEAGVGCLWHKYVGEAGTILSIDRFGISAPGDVVMRELGMTAENIVAVADNS